MKLNQSYRQKLEKVEFWQYVKHAKLCSYLFQALKEKPLTASGSLQRKFSSFLRKRDLTLGQPLQQLQKAVDLQGFFVIRDQIS